MDPLFDIASITISYRFHKLLFRLSSFFCHDTKSETSVLWPLTHIQTVMALGDLLYRRAAVGMIAIYAGNHKDAWRSSRPCSTMAFHQGRSRQARMENSYLSGPVP